MWDAFIWAFAIGAGFTLGVFAIGFCREFLRSIRGYRSPAEMEMERTHDLLQQRNHLLRVTNDRLDAIALSLQDLG